MIIAFCNATTIEDEDEFAILDESDRLGEAIGFSDQKSTIIIGEFQCYLLQQEFCKSSNNKLFLTQTQEKHRSLVDSLS